jgi:ABC-type Na+ transport system ATPase subunit NatA
MQLQIEDVSKTYPNGTRALHDVTLTMPEDLCGVLGPNGAGESTPRWRLYPRRGAMTERHTVGF